MTHGLAQHLDGGVFTLMLNRPDRRNALRWDMAEELSQRVRAVGTDADVAPS